MDNSDDLNERCRLCLTKTDDLVNIFEENESNSLVLRIMASVSLEVHRSDSLPKRICTACRYQLEKTYVFRSKCRENDTRLRRHAKLLAAGKKSALLEELDEEEDEFEASLQYIRAFDEASEVKKQREWALKLEEMKAKFRMEMDVERRAVVEQVRGEMLREKQDRMVEVGTETCDLGEKAAVDEFVAESLESQDDTAYRVDKPLHSFKQEVEESEEVFGVEILDESHDMDSVIEEVSESSIATESVAQVDSKEEIKKQFRANLSEKMVQQDDQLIQYLGEEMFMNVERLEEDGNSEAVSRTKIESHPSGSCTDVETAEKTNYPGDSHPFVISEVSDSETYVLDNELDQEEHHLYGSDSDEDLEAVTNAVKAELADQPGLDVGENCIMKVEKDRDLTKVEVRANDGSIICMEFSTEPKKKAPLSLAALRAKSAGGYKCPHCFVLFHSARVLQAHVSVTHANKGVVCDVCAKWCPTKSSLERHYRTHTGEKPYVCGECGRGFIQKEVLKRHMLTHTDERPFACEHCPRRFNQRDQWRHHVNMAHTPNPIVRMHRCTMCDKEFKFSSGLSRHLAAHYGRTFPCHCGKVFNDRSALKRHELALHKEKEVDRGADVAGS